MNTTSLNDVNTTSVRILVSVGLAAFVVMVAILGMVLGHVYTDADVHVLEIIGVGVLFMMGLDVTQLFLKRTSDHEYVRIKGEADAKVAAATSPPVTVGGPSTVTVQPAPVQEGSEAHP
jgi:hypothetical protein